jgi:hypothetical protein
MPIVATGPSCFTHSCEDAYFNPSTTAQSNSVLTLPPLHYKKKKACKTGFKRTNARNKKRVPVEKHLERE